MFNRILLNFDSVKLLLCKHLLKSSAYIFIFSLIFTAYNTASFCQSYGIWSYADSLNIPRVRHASVVLGNGNVLVMGGLPTIASCEIYDVSVGMWRYTNPMLYPTQRHEAILLNNGKVLVRGDRSIDRSEIFDPYTETWSLTGLIKDTRDMGFTITKLNNGEVLITGGYLFPNNYIGSCEIYNPDSNTWRYTNSLNAMRDRHSATLLKDGRVLVVGGRMQGDIYHKSAEIFDPITEQWTITDSLEYGRAYHAATLLPDGRVLISGGNSNTAYADYTCEIFDTQTQTWSMAGNMISYHSGHSAIPLNDTLILICGGQNNSFWELYNYLTLMPVYGDTTLVNTMLSTVNKLHNGEVIIIGGQTFDNGSFIVRDLCFLYQPAIVPVELTVFRLDNYRNRINLYWETATELNNKGFEVQRKFESNDWESLAFIPGKINSTQTCKYDYKDNLATSGKYTYRLKQIDLDGSFSFSKELEMIVNHPRELILHQNYPNPFNPTTFIDFQIPKPNHVKVELFDVLGNKVGVLLDDFKEAGFYKIKFDGSDLSSGMYLYKIEVGDYKATKKLILVK